MIPPSWPRWRANALGIFSSAVLLGVFAQGGWAFVLGFIALVPWLLSLRGSSGYRSAMLSAWAMSMAFAAAVFYWFGAAVGGFIGIPAWAATALMLLAAPLLQPQFIAFALVRQWSVPRCGAVTVMLAAASAWVACEWLLPKLLGDTLGHGLHPSAWLRQGADLGGAAGLSFALLLVNQAVAELIARRDHGIRALALPLCIVLSLPLAMAGYGALRLHQVQQMQRSLEQGGAPLRVAMVQSAIVDYETLRQRIGAYGVVRHVLDTHFELSHAAVKQQGADALLWSETVYPTTYGHAKSQDGAALDAEIQAFSDVMQVPMVFGTYDVDEQGEYNAAAFIEPGSGLLGFYRKTHPFPLTEYVPQWMDGPRLRGTLPWAGTWKPGYGARTLPLRTADGREVNVVPLICLDDVHPQLAIDGAALGGQAILGMSNDSWFSAYPAGARLHLQVATFRSVETRMPQLRVTNNGHSAIIDEAGEIIVRTKMGDAAVLTGHLWPRDPLPTLMQRWGDWVGKLALWYLLGLMAWRGAVPVLQRASAMPTEATQPFRADAVLLTPLWRALSAVLRAIAALGLLWLAVGMWRDGLQVDSLQQLQVLLLCILMPMSLSALIHRVFAARLRIEEGKLLIERRSHRIEIPLASLQAVQPWYVPMPDDGVHLHLRSSGRWSPGLLLDDADALMRSLRAAGAGFDAVPDTRWDSYIASRRGAVRTWFTNPLIKFGLFPLLLALPAFRLHQVIAFGGAFGEMQTYGWQAWLMGLGIWWGAWIIGAMLFAASLRVCIEIGACGAALTGIAGSRIAVWRRLAERIARMLFYLGMPLWLGWRLMAG